MSQAFVAIDLETTGFDPATDRIIEVGAVRFNRDGVIDRWRSFVNPGRPIPHPVQVLTSISEQDVAGAPSPRRAAAELAVFAGNSPLVGHNIPFDLAFLEEAGVHVAHPVFDTLELASVLLPTASSLELGELARQLGVSVHDRHRALGDAEATSDVFCILLERLDRLPFATLLDVRRLAEQSGWPILSLLDEALASAAAAPPAPPAARAPVAGPSLTAATGLGSPLDPLTPREAPRPVEDEDVRGLFALAAARPDLMPGFQQRHGQLELALAIARNLREHGRLAVEAGTGTGKSLAYLLPTLLHALRNDDRIVVSTHTRNLQEQLAQRELPAAAALVEAFEGVAPGTVRSTVLKGRANYLCLERLAQSLEAPGERALVEARLLARIGVWLPDTETGDLAELYVRADERERWRSLSAEGNDCLARRCSYVRDGSCFLQRARARAAAAHVVIVNHALLLADAVHGGQVLPPYRHLVVDEAHRLEDVATQRYGARVAIDELRGFIDSVGTGIARESTLAGRLSRAAILDASPLSPAAGLGAMADEVARASRGLDGVLPTFASALAAFIDEFAEDRNTERVVPIATGRRAQPMWGDVEEAALHVQVALGELAGRLERALDQVRALPEGLSAGLGDLRSQLARTLDAARRAEETLELAVQHGDPDRIVWLDGGGRGPAVCSAPLSVASELYGVLYADRASVLATSATLAAGGSFDYTLQRLGLYDADTLEVQSPFDYRRAVLALVVDDIPEPNDPAYEGAMLRALGAAARAAGGRTLALFTSHGALRNAAGLLQQRLHPEGISVLAQDVDGSPARLLRTLTERPRTLLLGTAAFWEGVDVRGDALSLIAMARLPFPVPTDPVFAGRSALYDDPFQEASLPHALLRFRQGFGRLIRGPEERGVFLVLDRRVLSRDYGQAFLDMLPDCEVRRVSTEQLGAAVLGWLAAR